MAAKQKKMQLFFLYIKKNWGETRGVQYFMNVSGGERNTAGGKAGDEKAPSCQKARMPNVMHTSVNAGVHKQHTGSSICNKQQPEDSWCPPPPSSVFGVKVALSQRSQIPEDTAEIALSRTQPATAALSADELPQLRGRQWRSAPHRLEPPRTRPTQVTTWIHSLQVRPPEHPPTGTSVHV